MKGIDNLLVAMTVDEKIGQPNMVAAGSAASGQVLESGAAKDIRAGIVSFGACQVDLWSYPP